MLAGLTATLLAASLAPPPAVADAKVIVVEQDRRDPCQPRAMAIHQVAHPPLPRVTSSTDEEPAPADPP